MQMQRTIPGSNFLRDKDFRALYSSKTSILKPRNSSMNRIASLALIFSLIVPAAFAEVKLPAIISDNMALQRSNGAHIWGWADPGEKVTVCFDGHNGSVKADCFGKWMVWLRIPCAGGPYEM